jgi:hypothetical protein
MPLAFIRTKKPSFIIPLLLLLLASGASARIGITAGLNATGEMGRQVLYPTGEFGDYQKGEVDIYGLGINLGVMSGLPLTPSISFGYGLGIVTRGLLSSTFEIPANATEHISMRSVALSIPLFIQWDFTDGSGNKYFYHGGLQLDYTLTETTAGKSKEVILKGDGLTEKLPLDFGIAMGISRYIGNDLAPYVNCFFGLGRRVAFTEVGVGVVYMVRH